MKLIWQHIWGGGLFLGVSHATTPRDGVPELPLLGFLSIYAYTLYRRTTKFEGGNTLWGGGLFLGGQPRPYSKGAGSQRSPILGSFLFMRTRFIAEPPNLKW